MTVGCSSPSPAQEVPHIQSYTSKILVVIVKSPQTDYMVISLCLLQI